MFYAVNRKYVLTSDRAFSNWKQGSEGAVWKHDKRTENKRECFAKEDHSFGYWEGIKRWATCCKIPQDWRVEEAKWVLDLGFTKGRGELEGGKGSTYSFKPKE